MNKYLMRENFILLHLLQLKKNVTAQCPFEIMKFHYL
jgi:hypothetical protein